MTPAAFRRVIALDRDGTIVADRGYLGDPAGLEFLPGAAEGLCLLHARGYGLIVISNQSGVGRGFFPADRLQAMNEQLIRMVRTAGAELAGIYCCPHVPADGCGCRKPGPGLLLRAAAELGFQASDAIVVGDSATDVESGHRVGARTILITADQRRITAAKFEPDFIAGNLLEAATLIVGFDVDAAPSSS